jgi:predicted nucleic acid-binding Zn finger protein
MWSERVTQVYKAILYAQEPHRFQMLTDTEFVVVGDNNTHRVWQNGAGLQCTCEYFQRTHNVFHDCCHIMALERMRTNDSASFEGASQGAEP